MELNIEERARGRRWLWCAGAVAVVLCLALAWIDHRLSTSRSEETLRQKLYELRVAQTSLGSGGSDFRNGPADR